MRIMKKGYCLSVLLCALLGLTACSNKGGTDQETPYYSVNIDGINEYRSEEDEDVKTLKELGLGYVEVTCAIDYQNTSRALEELDYYTKDTREEYVEYEYIESGIETIKDYEQVVDLVEYNISDIQFYDFYDEKRARVSCEYITNVAHATDQYLEDVEVKLNTKYKRIMTLNFVVEDGKWLISDYDITDREEVL